MRGTGLAAIAMLIVSGWMLADVIGHPAGTKAAGGVITSLWKTSAQGVTGQSIK
jgi:ABC-type transport system involved in cytochrome bd biosynthesis fused ATPase/permease subunit